MIKKIIKKLFGKQYPSTIVKANISVLAPNKLLEGKRAIITGGTSGIGFQIARSYLNAGARVLITGRSQSRIDDAISKICTEHTEYASKIYGMEMDVTDISNMESRFYDVF